MKTTVTNYVYSSKSRSPHRQDNKRQTRLSQKYTQSVHECPWLCCFKVILQVISQTSSFIPSEPFLCTLFGCIIRHLLYPEWVHIGVVACGDRQPETTVAVKAILATTSSHVFVHIFTEGELRASFHKEVCQN